MVTVKPEEEKVSAAATAAAIAAAAGDTLSMDSRGSGAGPTWFSSGQSAGILPSFVIGQSRGGGDGSGGGGGGVDGVSGGGSQWNAARVLAELRQRMRPWFSEFFRLQKFGCPPSLGAVMPRIKRNLHHFLTNYLCLMVILLIYCVITSVLMLLTLLVLGGLFYTIYQRTQKGPIIVASGYEIPPSLLYTLALAACFPLFYFADVGGTMYWVMASSLILIMAHSVFYSSEEVPGAEFEAVVVDA